MSTQSGESDEMLSNRSENSLLNRSWIRITAVVCMYWSVSISMVFLNKYLLSSEDLKLEAPIFITLSQTITAVLTFTTLGFISKYYSEFITFPAPEYNLSTIIKMAPVSIIFVGMITFNNFTLKYLGVAFYNVGRSMTTVFNVIFTFIVLCDRVSLRILTCCGFIVAGFLFGIKEEDKNVSNMSFLGIACGVLASMCVALYAIMIKRSLPFVDNNVWKLQMYNNLNACMLLLPLMIILGEIPVITHFEFWNSPPFWLILASSGMFGIAIGYVSSLQIKFTSPLSHNVSGTAKACVQTVLGCIIYSEEKSFWWWVCNFLVLGGSLAYTYFKTSEMENKKQQQEVEMNNKENGE